MRRGEARGGRVRIFLAGELRAKEWGPGDGTAESFSFVAIPWPPFLCQSSERARWENGECRFDTPPPRAYKAARFG